jgi:hypothetical protein
MTALAEIVQKAGTQQAYLKCTLFSIPVGIHSGTVMAAYFTSRNITIRASLQQLYHLFLQDAL